MSKTPQQFQLDTIKKKLNQQLTQCPKSFFQLLSFMDAHLRKQFKSFSIFALCQGSSHKLRFNDPAFQKAFDSLTIKQRLQLYQKFVNYGIQAFGKQKQSKQNLDRAIQKQIKILLPDEFIQFYITLHQGFRSSQQIKIRIEKFKITAQSNFSINLQNYILRNSKKKAQPKCYILQVINKTIPQKIRFSFANPQQESKNLQLIKTLADLAFKSSINSMIVVDDGARSPLRRDKKFSMRQSIGRLVQPKNSQNEIESSQRILQIQNTGIVDGKQVLQYSRILAQKQRESLKQNRSNNQIIQQLLSSNNQIESQNPVTKSQIQQKNTQNIFNKVLQNQNEIKQPFNSSSKKLTSPINRFAQSEVQQVQINCIDSNRDKIKHKNVFELMLPEFNLRQFEPAVSAKIFKQIYMTTTNGSNGFTIYQHKDKPQRFKCSLLIQNIDINKIYCALINQQILKKWNNCVDESQIKITLTAQNCLVCYQKHKRYNSWFKQRDYLFLRHGFQYRGCKYIGDRSIQHNSFIPFQSIQRGYIRHVVTRLRQIKRNQIQVIIDMSVDHGGFLGTQKKKQLNLNYLKQYEKLQIYLSGYKNNIENMTCYLNLQWSIDWIDRSSQSTNIKSISIKSDQFDIESQIQYNMGGQDEIDLQSQDYYSIKDQSDLDQQSKHKQDNDFIFQTTQGFANNQLINNKINKNNKNNQQQQKQLSQQHHQKQIQIQQHKQSFYDQLSILDPQIILNQNGQCILPQKYLHKKHLIHPKYNYSEQRQRLYPNIVLKDDFVQDKQSGILLVNKTKIDAQNSVLNFIMKTMRKDLFTGKSILSISLPVEIFKADSNTQRLCQSMTLGPFFLQKAANQTNPLQRMKWAICFALSNSILYFYIDKCFNPILGQTYQGIIDGCPIYAQQISHHPPISSILFIGRGYKVYANLEAKVYLHLNSGDGVNQGYYNIHFDDGHVIKFQTAPGQVSGFTLGDRKFKWKDKMYVYDKKNSFFTTLNFQDPQSGFFSKSKWSYADQMGGEVLKVTQQFIKKIEKSSQKVVPKSKQIQSILSKMQGRWLYYLKFDDKIYYNIVDDIPYKLVNYEYALNSDAKYRQDLIYRMRNDVAKSQMHKQQLENKQRKDRKLRQQYRGVKQH